METLLVMARMPGPDAKTRLAKDIGAEGAERVYRELLHLTLAQARGFAARPGCRSSVLVAGDLSREPDAFQGLDTRPQREGDLGVRIRGAFADAFAAQDCARAAVIGSDAPELDSAILVQAFDALATNDVVIGPATDGGYYLIGLRRDAWPAAATPGLEGIPWSGPQTAAVTIRQLADAGFSIALLPMLADVDTGLDYEGWLNAGRPQP